MRFSFSKKKFLKKIILGIGALSKHYAHSFVEYRAAAMEVVGKSFEQLGNNQNYLSLSDSF